LTALSGGQVNTLNSMRGVRVIQAVIKVYFQPEEFSNDKSINVHHQFSVCGGGGDDNSRAGFHAASNSGTTKHRAASG
jgi:hypothetical protein